MAPHKDVLTTGEVARICRVAPRTVSKWFDSGQLQGYRIPGSKDRRIPIDQLIRFMREHGIPMDDLERGMPRVLILDRDRSLCDALKVALSKRNHDVAVCESAFEAGAAARESTLQSLLVDISLPDVEPETLVRCFRSSPQLQDTRLIGMARGMLPSQGQALLQSGFDAYLAKPFDIHQLLAIIEGAVAPVAT